jgi:uncharacterized protein YaiI (UPF0178 family)
MSGNQTTPGAPQAAKQPAELANVMTAAEAAKQVKRTVVETREEKAKDGSIIKTEVTKQVAVKADEVLAHKDYGSHVVVVTTDGQKFSSADA